jgi:uncharacterized membrane protein (Fun14 family)
MGDPKGGGGGEGGGAKRGGFASWPLWKRGAFVIAALFVVAGLGMRGAAALSGEAARDVSVAALDAEGKEKVRVGDPRSPLIGGSLVAPGGAPGLATGASAGGETAKGAAAAAAAGPVLTQSGLAFFAAFCIGAALRALARVAVIVTGLALLGWIGLSLAGVVAPFDLSGLEGPFQTAMSHLQVVVGKIEGALSHALPSGTMAGLGLAAGLKKG